MRSRAQMMDPCLMIHHGHSQIRSVVLVCLQQWAEQVAQLQANRASPPKIWLKSVFQRSEPGEKQTKNTRNPEIPKPWKTQVIYKSLYKWWFSCQSDQLQDPGTAATSENCGSCLECIWQSLKDWLFKLCHAKSYMSCSVELFFSFDLLEASLPVSSSEVSSFSETHIWIYLNMSMQCFFVFPKKQWICHIISQASSVASAPRLHYPFPRPRANQDQLHGQLEGCPESFKST